MRPIQGQEWKQANPYQLPKDRLQARPEALEVVDSHGARIALCGTTDDARAIAALPKAVRALLNCGAIINGFWHTNDCVNDAGDGQGGCALGCIEAREVLAECGVDVG